MGRVAFTIADGATASNIVNVPDDVVGVEIPAAAAALGVAGPFTLDAGPSAADVDTVTFEGAAVPALAEHDCIGVHHFAAWNWFQLTATTGPTGDDATVYLLTRNFRN